MTVAMTYMFGAVLLAGGCTREESAAPAGRGAQVHPLHLGAAAGQGAHRGKAEPLAVERGPLSEPLAEMVPA